MSKPTTLEACIAQVLQLPAAHIPQDFPVNFDTFDSGGAILAESADEQSQLSGTPDQWGSIE